MSPRLRVAILGSTGSIGRQALDVASRFPDRIDVVALGANRSAVLLAEQACRCGARHVALGDPDAAAGLSGLPAATARGVGGDSLLELAALPDVDVVLNALVGAAGLRVSETALRAGKRLALANKESLVIGGDLLMPLASPGSLVPVDSEHSAIFQCLLGEPRAALERIWLTASGGPFRTRSRSELASVRVEEALAHPRWTMGPKITIDSATLMNKGLETIEAHHLFAVGYDAIRIVVHPQSTVHSMVEFSDGSVKAHLGPADMRLPIQYAFSHPDRWGAPAPPVDFTAVGHLDFEPPDLETFPCLSLALDAGRAGGTLPCAMNAANEVAVAAFLAGRIRFTDIDSVVETVMATHATVPVNSFEQLERVDAEARGLAEQTSREIAGRAG
jgi:1-deoxy-D-xylulose-5-phosphate reductoisomerase